MTESQFFEDVAGKEGVTFFRRVQFFYIKNKLKSEIFNNKKSIGTKIFFYVITKTLATYERWDGVKDEKLWGFSEKSDFSWGLRKTSYRYRQSKTGE